MIPGIIMTTATRDGITTAIPGIGGTTILGMTAITAIITTITITILSEEVAVITILPSIMDQAEVGVPVPILPGAILG